MTEHERERRAILKRYADVKAEIQKVLAVRGANANYVGEYKDDKMHGQGTYSSSNPFIPFLSSLEV
ncbi:MAG TPA: MORN repeat-containing protein [Deltaproteobacteria bacterium]|nr:MORN repeat-containing protein [Candidatus Lambdaproteobacteria bacterium]HIL15780.1 MORN repeat-containing protein [Deltaproteobacteria bacterium]HIL87804.1 MORN repeat-containing protein [Deltaproteobacteria bacterium]